jgi:hypothetical protein
VPNEVPQAAAGKRAVAAGRIAGGPRAGISVAQASGTIIVEGATYGGNCGAGKGNATIQVSNACNGQTLCQYVVDFRVIGDPAPGCVKDFSLSYTCAGSQTRKEVRISGEEAGFEKTVVLSCP